MEHSYRKIYWNIATMRRARELFPAKDGLAFKDVIHARIHWIKAVSYLAGTKKGWKFIEDKACVSPLKSL